jgi:hypothetical protein
MHIFMVGGYDVTDGATPCSTRCDLSSGSRQRP